MSLHPANGVAGLPVHRPDVIAAHNPWDAKVSLQRREMRMSLLRQRRSNPLPCASPYWKKVRF